MERVARGQEWIKCGNRGLLQLREAGTFPKGCKLAKGKGKGKPSQGKGLNSVEQKEEPEAETSYLEIPMLEAMDETTSEGEPAVPYVGVPKRTRDLAKRRYRRLLREGSTMDWRSIPISRYRQRCAAMAEAQLAFPGSVGRMVARRILESEGLEDACSSCDERRPIVREATAQYAAKRSNIPPTDLQAYEEEQSEETVESDDDGQPLEPIPEEEEPEEEDDEEASEASPQRWSPFVRVLAAKRHP